MPSASLGCISIPRESVSSSFFSFFVVALSVLSQKCTDALNTICNRYSSFSCSPRMFFTVFDDFVHSLLTLTPSALRFDLLESLRLSARSGDLEICCSDEGASEKPLLLFTFSHPSSAKSSSRTSSLLPFMYSHYTKACLLLQRRHHCAFQKHFTECLSCLSLNLLKLSWLNLFTVEK